MRCTEKTFANTTIDEKSQLEGAGMKDCRIQIIQYLISADQRKIQRENAFIFLVFLVTFFLLCTIRICFDAALFPTLHFSFVSWFLPFASHFFICICTVVPARMYYRSKIATALYLRKVSSFPKSNDQNSGFQIAEVRLQSPKPYPAP